MATHLPPGLSPDSVDALTELTSIITRLRAAAQGSTTSGAPTGPTSAPVPTGSQPQGATPAGVTGTTPLPNPTNPNLNPTTSGIEGTLLSVKDLPAATDSLKHKLQRARQAVRTLADTHRSIAAQEAELAVLEERRKAQAARLGRTQEDGLVFVRRCVEGEGEGEGDRMVE